MGGYPDSPYVEAGRQQLQKTPGQFGNLQNQRLAESQRVQGATVAEGSRVQGIMAEGEQFKFSTTERRQQDKIDQTYDQMIGAGNRQQQANQDRTAAITGAIGGVASIGSSMMQGGLSAKVPGK